MARSGFFLACSQPKAGVTTGVGGGTDLSIGARRNALRLLRPTGSASQGLAVAAATWSVPHPDQSRRHPSQCDARQLAAAPARLHRSYWVPARFASVMTLAQRTVSDFTKSSSCCSDLLPSPLMPSVSSGVFIPGEWTAAFTSLFSFSRTGFGVPPGASRACQATVFGQDGRPSASGLMSGAVGNGLSLVMPRTRALPALICGNIGPRSTNSTSTSPEINAMVEGALPRYGTWVIVMPVRLLNSAAQR